MIVKTLSENTSISDKFCSEHGLSLYIETIDHKLLFDVGASGLFLKNAKGLGVNIADVEYLVISHGHYDHGGGLSKFLQVNMKAEVFLNRFAFEKHYAMRSGNKMEDIGLDEKLKDNDRIVFTTDRSFVTKGIQVFSNVAKNAPLPVSNKNLFAMKNGRIVADDFLHEQNLIIDENGKTLLITGCAHNGIVNIIEHFHTIRKRMPDFVIGGFHLSSRSGNKETQSEIEKISNYLLDTNAMFYTCHCTGLETYSKLKSLMKDRIDYLSVGSMLEL